MMFDLMFASGAILKIPSIGNMDQKCYLEVISMLILFCPLKLKSSTHLIKEVCLV